MLHLRSVLEHRLPWAKRFRDAVANTGGQGGERSSEAADICGRSETV